MENFVRQHPLYDVEKDLQELLRQQAGNIRLSTQDNAAVAGDIAQRSSPPCGPRQLSPDMLEDLKKASDDQVARLAGVQEQTDQQIVQKLDDMSQMQELIKDFNLFESLYRTQQDLAQQTQAYNRPGQLEPGRPIGLEGYWRPPKSRWPTRWTSFRQKLARRCQAAAKNFSRRPAQSGRDLADQIDEHRMEPLAEQATGEMLAGDGEQSFQLADRLRSEMEKLFGECQGGNCPSGDELDAYLRLQRMNPGNNFAQMARSRKFGFGKGHGLAGGMGQGTDGYLRLRRDGRFNPGCSGQ